MLHNGCWYLEILECDQSDYTRGDNRGRADLQRGGQAGVSRLKFPLKDREPRWQGSTTFSDSCLFMISNLVNPLFHCNSQYSWYKGLKAIGVTGRRKMDKDISGALISVQCLQPDVSKWPQKRLSLWDLSKLYSTCFGSSVLIFGTRKLREWWIWFQVTRHDGDGPHAMSPSDHKIGSGLSTTGL